MNGIILALALNALFLELDHFAEGHRRVGEIGGERSALTLVWNAPSGAGEIRVFHNPFDLDSGVMDPSYRDEATIFVSKGASRRDIQRDPLAGKSDSLTPEIAPLTTEHLDNPLDPPSRCLTAVFHRYFEPERHRFFSPPRVNLAFDGFNGDVGAQLAISRVGEAFVGLVRGPKSQGDINDAKECNDDCNNGGPEQALRPYRHFLLSLKVLLSACIFAGGTWYGVQSLSYASRGRNFGEIMIGALGMLIGVAATTVAIAVMIY